MLFISMRLSRVNILRIFVEQDYLTVMHTVRMVAVVVIILLSMLLSTLSKLILIMMTLPIPLCEGLILAGLALYAHSVSSKALKHFKNLFNYKSD